MCCLGVGTETCNHVTCGVACAHRIIRQYQSWYVDDWTGDASSTRGLTVRMSRHLAVVTFLMMKWQMRKTMTQSTEGPQRQIHVTRPKIQQEQGRARVPVRLAEPTHVIKHLGSKQQLFAKTKRPGWQKVSQVAAEEGVQAALSLMWPEDAPGGGHRIHDGERDQWHVVRRTRREEQWTCDGCDSDFEAGEDSHKCQEGCDFDLCRECWHGQEMQRRRNDTFGWIRWDRSERGAPQPHMVTARGR